jgi:HipA-like protein
MIKTLRQKFQAWIGGVEALPTEEKLTFKVLLGDLSVGTLRAESGEWVFCYSPEFRAQSRIKPIVDFPVLDKEYRSKTLWAFFALRIPSLEQPAVREFVRQQPEEKADEGILLKEFGERSIANPFRLVPCN